MFTKKGKNVYEALLVLAGGVYLLLAKGVEFMNPNQALYFISGLRMSDPKFITKDWFTWQVFHHDFAFGYIVSWLQKVGPLNITAVAADIVVLTILSYSLFLLCRRFCRYPLMTYILLIVWLAIISPNEIGLGGQFLYCGILQPAEVSASFMASGIILLLLRRYFLSGVLLGVGGMCHASYLVSFAPTVFVATLLAGVWRSWRVFLLFSIPVAFCWGSFIFVLWKALSLSAPPTPQTVAIMTQLRAPGDFIVTRWPFNWTLNWFLWAFLGLLAMSQLPKEDKFKELRMVFLTFFLTSLFGMIQAIVINVPAVTMLMLWRSSPMVIILGLVVVLDRCYMLMAGLVPGNKRDTFFIAALAIVGLVLIFNKWDLHMVRRFLWVLSFPTALAAGWVAYSYKKDAATRVRIVTVVLIAMMSAIVVKTSFRGIELSHDNQAHPIPVTLGAAEAWIRQNTPADAVIVMPIELQYMRVRAHRAIVVDWVAAPYRPTDLREWYQRLCDVCGVPPQPLVTDVHRLISSYNGLDTNRARMLQQKYGVGYVVVRRTEHHGELSGLIERFTNEDFKIMEIPEI